MNRKIEDSILLKIYPSCFSESDFIYDRINVASLLEYQG